MKKKRKVGSVNYYHGTVPPDYKCDDCGATGVKLWRKSHTFADYTQLLCAKCTGKLQKEDISTLDEDGMIISSIKGIGKTDNIGWYVPAIPVPGDDTYWGYTSVPPDGATWWRKLPNLPTGAIKT